jgi:hypothetical protein
MAVKHNFFRVSALCSLTILGFVSCLPAPNPNSYSAIPTGPTYTLAPPASTSTPAFDLWSATPDVAATVNYVLTSLPPPESNAVWTSTPGWLTPPSPTFAPSDIPTATIIFDIPKPGQEQGVRGTVVLSGGPASENGIIPTPHPSCCITILARDPVTDQIMADTQSGDYGVYELQLLPGRYNICTAAAYGTDYCTSNVIITAGSFLTIDFGVAMP